MSTKKKVTALISGGGIGGPVLAYWLNKGGIECTLIERADQLRLEGQVIDIRSSGVEVIRKMGLEEIIRSKTTHEDGMAFVDRDDHRRAFFPVDAESGQSFTCDIEIMRGVLATVFYDATKDDVKWIFGDYITAINETAEKCTVEFNKGPTQDFDIVVAADGWGSRTRAMGLKLASDYEPIQSLNHYCAFFSIPRQEQDGTASRWCSAPGGISMILRPDGDSPTRAYLNITRFDNPDLTDRERFRKLNRSQKMDILREYFKDAGWEAPRILGDMDSAEDFYMQEIVLVKLDRWSSEHGRFAVLGDAGYAVPGMGTSAAIIGAYTLAGNIFAHMDDKASSESLKMAMDAYESDMRPLVTKAQQLPPGTPRNMHPQTQWGINIFNAVLGFVSWVGLGGYLQRYVAYGNEDLKTFPMEMSMSK
eukprot:TRINITY_DN807_c0_g2_i1.p1 TRINITY_DN807_c0_g2~~TRINITY_DN807_c0_g2_i1.p1  ORF type:complete len:420 (-),score=129.47 TRINITY_DN807_c0_g2_i1:16-1275(-)